RAQPALAARGHPAGGGAPRPGGAGRRRRHPDRRHADERAPPPRDAPPGHPHHDAPVAVPRAHVAGARGGRRRRDGRRRRQRRLATHPPDILITTPESLFLVLTSQARAGLVGVETVVVDEIHAVAGTKRGAHLAVSLERLDALLEANERPPAQRVGLSATVRP